MGDDVGRIAKCFYCKQNILTDERIKFKNKYYHKECLETFQNEITEKEQAKKEQKKIEVEEYKTLVNAICEVFHIDAPTAIIANQIKNFKTKNKYTYLGMLYTLYYITDVLHKKLALSYGISLVAYYYEEAEHYYLKQQQLVEYNEQKVLQSEIQSIQVNYTNHPPKKPQLIDLSKL